jgi:DNA-3-methyladenine glycosylase
VTPLYGEFARIIAAVPSGRVVSYGQVARMAGRPGSARAVGWFLRASPAPDLPWHRVVGGDGFLRPQAGGALGIGRQRARLLREGVRVRRDGWLSLQRYRWQGGGDGRPPSKRTRVLLNVVPPLAFYRRPVVEVARDLLGCLLVRRLPSGNQRTGRIVEVEAYDGNQDRACHAFRGRTQRTEPLFGPPGRAYVYLIYGMYHCLNVVTGPPGHAAAVLLRAAEVLDGTLSSPSAARHRLASGPGRLCRYFDIDRRLNRCSLRRGELVILRGTPPEPREIRSGPRIGVEYAGVWARKPWRFALRGSPALSVPFRRR